MARTDDVSTTITPKWLLVLTATFMALRVGAYAFETSRPAEAVAHVNWRAAQRYVPDEESAGKLILLQFYAAWCEPCKRMDTNVFVNKQIADLINERFVGLRVTDRLKEDGKNPEFVTALEKRYHVFAFPTLVVARPDGEAVATLVGASSALSTYHFLTRALRSGN